jgi:chemotaxis response regulator CheB
MHLSIESVEYPAAARRSPGLDGARAIKADGGIVFAEAESTCVVYGMPRALAEAGIADSLLPIGEMAKAIRAAAMSTAEHGAAVLVRSGG